MPRTVRRSRYSVQVPKRIAPRAVVRNRIRRRISEALRVLRQSHTFATTRFSISPFDTDIPVGETLRRELLALLRKSDIVSE